MNLSSPFSRTTNPWKSLLRGYKNGQIGERVGSSVGGPFECIDGHVEKAFCDNAKVREVLHVAPVDKIGGWKICTDRIRYHPNTESLLPIYPTLIKNYRTLIYNGDVDGCVPYIGNEQWTSSLGFSVKTPWSPWLVDDQVAGYITVYDENDFKFVTVKGAGHMVPQYKPKSAFYMFERFLLNRN